MTNHIPEIQQVFEHEQYLIYASPISTGEPDSFLNEIVVHDTTSNTYANHIEAWFRNSESAEKTHATLTAKGYTYQTISPSESAISTLKQIHSIDVESECEGDGSTGFVYLVFIPAPERVNEDGFGNYYHTRGIH